MRRIFKLLLCVLVILSIVSPMSAFAREGDCGYEGGISSGQAPGKVSYEYQEVCFITGEPVVFKGTLIIKKSMKQNNIISTYTYTLKNLDRTASLTRVLSLNSKLTVKDNGQTVEETALNGKTSETIKIGNTTYTLKNYEFTRTNLIDSKPAVNYYAGNIWGKKTYQVGNGTAAGVGTIAVEETGNFYGYDQYWGTTEAMSMNYYIESELKKDGLVDKWGGTANVSLSSSTVKKLKYVENQPNQISFKGGYVQTQSNESIMEYSCKLPEFDAKGVSTDAIKEAGGSLKIESFPVQTRLLVPSITHIRGHWAENEIKTLYSLEILKGNDRSYNPEQYISRGEFAAMIVEAAKEVPKDPALINRAASGNSTTGRNSKNKITSSFEDVSTGSTYFEQIDAAYKRGLMGGTGDNTFGPNNSLVVADALTVFVRALGLESLAPGPAPVTSFRDNDEIPPYARNAVYVAEKIGLIRGDTKGYLYPGQKLTKARTAVLVNRFIDYMREGIRKDYRERIVNYQ